MAKKTEKKVIEIVEWLERYDVSINGREPKPGDDLRAGPLNFVRLKVYGHTQSTGFRRLKSVAGKRTMEVFGYFCKFLEIAANQKRGQRGILLNEKNMPATPEDLAFILDVPLEQVENAIRVLSDEKVGWINCKNSTQLNSTQHNTRVANFSEISENSEISEPRGNPRNSGKPKDVSVKKFTKPTPEEVEAYGKSIGFAINGHEFIDFYESKGWVIGKSKMKDWKASVRTWKSRKEKGGTDKTRREFATTSDIGETIEA